MCLYRAAKIAKWMRMETPAARAILTAQILVDATRCLPPGAHRQNHRGRARHRIASRKNTRATRRPASLLRNYPSFFPNF